MKLEACLREFMVTTLPETIGIEQPERSKGAITRGVRE